VVLRVHSDPISIIGKVLEQNSRSYTRIQHFVDLGSNMVMAGLTVRKIPENDKLAAEQDSTQLTLAERRITYMCIEAALKEDDFETAYSYVVNRVAQSNNAKGEVIKAECSEDWSWQGALHAGQYIRTAKTVRPTHLGTASGNPEIRHLEQRMECLATALRIAPKSQLQEVLKTFRRCEEQLDSAIKEDAAKENAWDAAGDLHVPAMPGGFGTQPPSQHQKVQHSVAESPARETDDVPMSLFDLSRATARAASRNLGTVSSLYNPGYSASKPSAHASEAGDEPRTRKRDQFRDAAMGTLVSGVGWLVGAQPADRASQDG
jgi:protein transport protein SEC39